MALRKHKNTMAKNFKAKQAQRLARNQPGSASTSENLPDNHLNMDVEMDMHEVSL